VGIQARNDGELRRDLEHAGGTVSAHDSSHPDADLATLVGALIASYRASERGSHVNRHFLPSRDEIVETLQLLMQLIYPGYFGRQDLTDENVAFHAGVLISTIREKLARQIESCLCFTAEVNGPTDVPTCRRHAWSVATRFLERLPAVRAVLLTDMQAAFDGDPAALNVDEIILAYPGMLAVSVQRLAHELHVLGVPLMPRIMTEWAHAKSGADIHPGAEIGERFFIDHATGVVIGETTKIGAGVRLYQGVTLGALSLPRDAVGRVIRKAKRHPTVEDDVTIYANATVLGGETVLGKGCVIGGSLFVTRSVPAYARVALKPPEMRVSAGGGPPTDDPIFDFEI
jgi:serine O-acetyltransferase